MSTPLEVSKSDRPHRDECEVLDFDVDLLGSDDRIHVRYFLHEGRVVEFAMMQQAMVGPDEWADVVKVDCCHDEVHVHRYSSAGVQVSRTVIRPIRSLDDVETGLDEAEELIYEHWEENRRRWNDGR